MLRIAKISLLATLLATLMAGMAQAGVVDTSCFAPIESRVLTGNDLFQTTSKTFVRVHGAALTVVVPATLTRCIKVRFTGGVTCKAPSGTETCFIRALADGVEMNPQGAGQQALSGELLQPTGLGFQWVKRLGPGQHVIQIQVRSVNVPESITVGVNDWMMDVEVLN
jgi:hypothetical protein